MYPRAQLSGQGACCLDIGFRHMSSVPDCASFWATHVPCGRIGGNYVMMCIYFVRFVYSTVNCVLAVCVRNDLGRPTFQSIPDTCRQYYGFFYYVSNKVYVFKLKRFFII